MARAAISIDISLLGDKRLARTLGRLPIAVQKKLLRKGLRAGAKVILSRARSLASRISSRLASKLKVRALKRRGRGTFGAVVITPKKSELDIPENAKGYWPAHMELGFTHTSGKQVPARPYLRPAADEGKEEAFRKVADSMREAIDAEWNRK